jgi:hypothetical protein
MGMSPEFALLRNLNLVPPIQRRARAAREQRHS